MLLSSDRHASRDITTKYWVPPTAIAAWFPIAAAWWICLGCLAHRLAADDSAPKLAVESPIELVVDHYVEARLKAESIEPASQVSDANWIRRVMLDLNGRPPSFAETDAFAKCTDAEKRALLVDRLMSSPGFLRHQTDELESLLMYPDSGNLRDYLKDALAADRRWDQLFRELMTPDRGEMPAGANAFLKSRIKDLDKLTNEVSVRFFGVNISCAQCHDHPLVSDWRQEHYFGMKSFFARTFENGGFVGEREYGQVDYTTTDGEQRRAKLMFLNGEQFEEPESVEPAGKEKQDEKKRLDQLSKDKQPPPPPNFSRRAQVVEAGLSPVGRQWLARSITNRIWYRLMGFGLVMPVDQMHSENPSSHPELLEWLAEDLIRHDFDLKRLIRGLVLSRAYARDSEWESAADRPADHLFAVGRVRLLTPYQMAAALKTATVDPIAIGPAIPPSESANHLDNAAQAGRSLSSHFEMPRDQMQVSVSEALYLNNNSQLMRELLHGGLVDRLAQIPDNETMVDTAVQSILLRQPAGDEREMLVRFVQDRPERRLAACQQIVWSLLSSSEFRFNY